MFKTQFLTKEDTGFKQFKSLNVFDLTSKKISLDSRKQVFAEIQHNLFSSRAFCNISKGALNLPFANQIYFMEYLPHNCDLILPKAININDWVVLSYDQTTMALDITLEKSRKQTFKLYSTNSQRIMGLDEPLVCDMPFMSLRLTFLGDIDGWVVT